MPPRPLRPIRTLPSETESERLFRWALWSVFLVTLARLAWIAFGHADLSPEEALRWISSRSIAPGYYAEPPMVAWLIAASVALFRESGAAVRLPAVLIQFAAALAVYGTAARLYDPKTALWSALAYATLIGVSHTAVIMSSEAPLALAWAVCLYAFIRAREGGDRRWWLIVGIAFGLGLLSQYAMVYWFLAAGIFIAALPEERRHVPMLLGAGALGLLIYSPNLLWNVAHGFAGYRDGGPVPGGSAIVTDHWFRFLGAQFVVFGPLFLCALVLMLVLARRSFADRRNFLLLSFMMTPLVAMLVRSFIAPTAAESALPAYVAGTILIVGWLLGMGRRAIVIAAIALNVAVAAVVMVGLRNISVWVGAPIPVQLDPLHRIEGWRSLGRAVTSLMLQHPGAMLMSDDPTLLATLMFYVRPHVTDGLEWTPDRKVRDPFTMTQQPALDLGADFLLVATHPEDVEPILARFAHAGPPQSITIFVGAAGATRRSPPLQRRFEVYYLEGFKGFAPAK
jgi:4-amino-4-deoxy-L-arabinose transferase-like glycosyltransferase